jgi:hypothetical protein
VTNEPTRIVREWLERAAAEMGADDQEVPPQVAIEQMKGRVLVSEAVLLKMVEYLKKIHAASGAALSDPNTFSALATATDARNCLTVLLGDVKVEQVSPGIIR